MKWGPKPSRAVVDEGACTQFRLKKEFPMAKRVRSSSGKFAAGKENEFRPSANTVASPAVRGVIPSTESTSAFASVLAALTREPAASTVNTSITHTALLVFKINNLERNSGQSQGQLGDANRVG